MYKKVKKALESMGYDFLEFEKVEFENGITVLDVFQVGNLYIEIGTPDIEIWSMDGKIAFIISKKEFYLMMFELGWILGKK